MIQIQIIVCIYVTLIFPHWKETGSKNVCLQLMLGAPPLLRYTHGIHSILIHNR